MSLELSLGLGLGGLVFGAPRDPGAIWAPMGPYGPPPPWAWAPPRAQRLMALGGPWVPEQPLMSLGSNLP